MVDFYGFQRNFDIRDLPSEALALPFRIGKAQMSLDYGCGKGALILDLVDEDTGRDVRYTIIGADRARKFVRDMGVSDTDGLTWKNIVGFVDGRHLCCVAPNNPFTL